MPENFDTKSLLKLVADTQKAFTNRKQNQERWEINPLEWMNNNKEQHLIDLRNINFITEDIVPRYKQYGAVCILGAVNSTMQYRVQYCEKLVDSGISFEKVFLLSGARSVSHVDGKEDELLDICKKMGVERKNLTEANILQNIFNNSTLSKNYVSVLIDSAAKNGIRPTTKDTVLDFYQWVIDNNFKGKVLFISNQPNVLYQKAVISEVLDGKGIDFEVVGPKTNSQNIQTIAGALGSFLWAFMPKVINELGLKVVSNEEIALVKSLYGNSSPLLK